MSKSNDDRKLMRYYDGELGGAQAAGLPLSESDRRKLESLEQVGEVVRAYYEDALGDKKLQLDSMWWRLEGHLDEIVAQPAAARGVIAWLRARRGYVLTGLVGAIAGAFVALGTVGAPRVIERQVVVYRDVPAVAPPGVVPAAQNAVVEALEVVGGAGTVLQIPSADARQPDTTVIWVTPWPTEDPI